MVYPESPCGNESATIAKSAVFPGAGMVPLSAEITVPDTAMVQTHSMMIAATVSLMLVLFMVSSS
jgi:hypothetical protein